MFPKKLYSILTYILGIEIGKTDRFTKTTADVKSFVIHLCLNGQALYVTWKKIHTKPRMRLRFMKNLHVWIRKTTRMDQFCVYKKNQIKRFNKNKVRPLLKSVGWMDGQAYILV